MRRLFLLIVFLLFGVSLHAGDFFTGELKSKRIHLIIEGAAGGDFYRSPLSPLYKTDQWAFQGTLTLGYKFNDNIFAGAGGGFRHCAGYSQQGRDPGRAAGGVLYRALVQPDQRLYAPGLSAHAGILQKQGFGNQHPAHPAGGTAGTVPV